MTPAQQWWVINGAVVLEALQRAWDGEDPEALYLELYANTEDPEDPTP